MIAEHDPDMVTIIPGSEPFVFVKTEETEGQPLESYLLDSQNYYQEIFRKKLNPITLVFNDEDIEKSFSKKRRSSFGAFAISLLIFFVNFCLLTSIEYLAFNFATDEEKPLRDLSGIFFLPVVALVFLLVFLVYKDYKRYNNSDPSLYHKIALRLRKLVNLHVCALICLWLMTVSLLMNVPEVLDLCCGTNGCDFSNPDPKNKTATIHQSTPIDNFCKISTKCPTGDDVTTFIVGSIFLVIMNGTNFERLRSLAMNFGILIILLAYVGTILLVPGAWVVFQYIFIETFPILICFVLAAFAQNYNQEYHFRQVFLLRKSIKNNFQRIIQLQEETEQLILNILPVHVARRLQDSYRPDNTMAQKVPYSTILFCSISNFAELLNTMEIEDAMWILNDVVCKFDDLCDFYGVEKIKTNGPYYMAVTGLEASNVQSGHAAAKSMAKFSLAMLETIGKFNSENSTRFELRIGLNYGPCVSGVIGKKKFSFDIWGDSVNVASRMESTNLPRKIQVSRDVALILKDSFHLTRRGMVPVKGKGEMETYFLEDQIKS